jgi:tetratricopeptide (TPR) repeat protein
VARIFISYSHQDEAFKNHVVRHLNVLAPEGLLSVWDDRQIAAGDAWQAEIEAAMAQCDAALLLVSSYFLTSQFILGQEVPALLRRREQEGMRVVPVILAPFAWSEVKWLNAIQARPKDGAALSSMTTHQQDEALAKLAEELADLLEAAPTAAKPTARPSANSAAGPQIDLHHLPEGAPHFQARQTELAAMTAAWQPGSGIHILSLIAPGGVGKTSLIKRWLDGQKKDGWPSGVQRVFGWSFYSQGASADRQTSDEPFLNAALKWFGVAHAENAQAWEKGEKLAQALRQQRCLLVLDGLEPLQYPPSQAHNSAQLAGKLRAPGVQALLQTLASSGHGGLVLISSREALADLAEHQRHAEHHPSGSLLQLNLGNLSAPDGARLLFASGATRAGAAPPLATPQAAAEDEEWQAASREVQGHALTLRLLGAYLHLAHGGDVRRRSEVRWAEANDEALGGDAFKVMKAYETWFEREGPAGQRSLAALRLLGFFDRPAPAASIAALRAAPAVAGLTEALEGLSDTQWRSTLTRLADIGLLTQSENGTLDAHPLLREYLAQTLQQQQPAAWREGHRRVFEQLCADTPHRPDGVEGLAPLYQAVVHGCAAGLQQKALDAVYWDRILRGDEAYSSHKLGAFGAELGALACFFSSPWSQVHPGFSASDQSWLLSEAAFDLRALGRLAEAQAPMRVGAEMRVQQTSWKNAARAYGNLSELQLTLGEVASAVAAAEQAVAHANTSQDEFLHMAMLTTLADAQHQQGETALAAQHFQQAEALQQKRHPTYPLLYSLRGFRYCEHLLASAELNAWAKRLAAATPLNHNGLSAQPCQAVAQRAAQTLVWAIENNVSLLDIALNHLTLAHCALYQHWLGQPSSTDDTPAQATLLATARSHADKAVNGLRAAGTQDHLPRGLLTRACILHSQGEPQAAERDLAEAQRIAQRGGMKLHLADVHLTRARLLGLPQELAPARQLIEACGYRRRLPELEMAEAVLLGPAPAPKRA